MKNLQELIELCQNEQGKIFVLGPDGNVSMVMLSIEEYHKLLSKPKFSVATLDPEAINRKIIRAQLEEQGPATVPQVQVQEPVKPVRPKVDLREEVIDPSFDFDAPEEQSL